MTGGQVCAQSYVQLSTPPLPAASGLWQVTLWGVVYLQCFTNMSPGSGAGRSEGDPSCLPLPCQVLPGGCVGGADPGDHTALVPAAGEAVHPQHGRVLPTRGCCPPRLLRRPGQGTSTSQTLTRVCEGFKGRVSSSLPRIGPAVNCNMESAV